MRYAAIAVLLAVGTLAACGDDDGSSAGSESLQPYADALAGTFTADNAAGGLTFTDESAHCVADRSVEVIGRDRLEAVGDPQDVVTATKADLRAFALEPAELDAVATAFLDCIPGAEQALRDAFVGGARLEGDQATCVADLVDRDLLVQILAAGIGGKPADEAVTDVQADFAACTA